MNAPQPPVKAATEVPREENRSQSTPHDPARCATCLGFQPWTEERREAVRSAMVGRRVCDLEPAL